MHYRCPYSIQEVELLVVFTFDFIWALAPMSSFSGPIGLSNFLSSTPHPTPPAKLYSSHFQLKVCLLLQKIVMLINCVSCVQRYSTSWSWLLHDHYVHLPPQLRVLNIKNLWVCLRCMSCMCCVFVLWWGALGVRASMWHFGPVTYLMAIGLISLDLCLEKVLCVWELCELLLVTVMLYCHCSHTVA